MKPNLERISKVLKAVHKQLLDNERIAAEIRLNRHLAPLEFFNLLTRDESFAWLKPLSALMAEVDEFLDETENVSESDIAKFRDRIEFVLRDPSSKLATRYLQYLPQDPDFIIAHAELRDALGPAPVPQKK